MIKVSKVTFRYGVEDEDAPDTGSPVPGGGPAMPALTDVSFTVPEGSLTVLCGASGCGKSSALRLLNGLVPHFHTGELSGSVEVAGRQVSDSPLVETGRVSATVFQNPRTQFFTSEVLSELAFRNENYGLDPQLIRDRISEQGEALGVAHLLGRNLRQLSGGELQRVACAQAVMSNTPVLLFDEPTSNLSVPAIADFAALLRRLKADGKTLVVAEHRLAFLEGLADQVLLMEGGRVARRFTGAEFFALTDQQRRDLGLRRLHRDEGVFAGHPPVKDKSVAECPVISEHDAPVQAQTAPTETGSTPAPSPTAHAGEPISAPVARPAEALSSPSEPLESGVSLRKIRAGYGKRIVLEIPALDLPAGEVTAIVGHNGVGKSTLAKLLSGLLKPLPGGSIYRHGTLRKPEDLQAETALVMQDVHRQLFSAKVKDEITLGLSKERQESIDVPGLLEQFELADLADRHPLSLSGGQKQRLVIAAAVARDAQLYLFDEPTSGVDYRHLRRIAARLNELAASGVNVLVITHDPELIDACADSLLVLRPGDRAETAATCSYRAI
ncbi:ABC transporter ATP-binding protein [Boudabousia marimammalium]|uniref:ABC transporter ATP-binding protein n=1 Tax=Boudabousia marimammalium TaxID=156892 RepID=UPI0009FF273C|nr:ABC transporter ATP-binding protein [Boudabousia marimammalium]